MAEKIALVSGANKGIGKEVARQLGKNGFKVFVGSRDLNRGQEAVADLKKDGVNAEAVQLDVLDEASVEKALSSIDKAHGKLDVLVNNAGIVAEPGPGLDVDLASVDKTMQTNFMGPLRLLQKAVPLLEKSGDAKVVNVSSTLGSHERVGGFDDAQYIGYCGSKAALNMLTVIAAHRLADKKIKVNSICPGYVATDINNNQGPRTVEQGAAIVLKMATVGADGPTGSYFDDAGVIPW